MNTSRKKKLRRAHRSRSECSPALWILFARVNSQGGGVLLETCRLLFSVSSSEVAQWERAGLITLRSLDRNQPSLPRAAISGWPLFLLLLGPILELGKLQIFDYVRVTPFLAEKLSNFQTLSANLCTKSSFKRTNRVVNNIICY